jgi:hypothetical protein
MATSANYGLLIRDETAPNRGVETIPQLEGGSERRRNSSSAEVAVVIIRPGRRLALHARSEWLRDPRAMRSPQSHTFSGTDGVRGSIVGILLPASVAFKELNAR